MRTHILNFWVHERGLLMLRDKAWSLTWFHLRWWGSDWIMIFVPDSKSWSKGYRVRIFQIHMPNSGNSIALWRLENQVSTPCLHNTEELNFALCRVGGKTWFLSLYRAMECPILVQYYCGLLKKIYFSSLRTQFVRKTNQNYHFWTKL